jgi:hypothetical protein
MTATRTGARRAARALQRTLATIYLAAFPTSVFAQAFVPPAGEGNVTIAYQNLFARGHLDLNGDRMEGPAGTDPVWGHAFTVEAEFGLTRRLAVNASIPYIRSKYGGETPHLVGGTGPPQEWDDGTYHGTWQDFHLGLRYNVVTRPLAATALAEWVIPSHDYPPLAHAAVGKDLHALIVGGAVGGFVDRLLPGLFFQSQFSFARTEPVVGIRPNRSRVDGEVGYFITPRLAVRFLESCQLTHDGFDLISFATPMTEALFHSTGTPIPANYRRYHDQLQRSDYLTLGGGAALAVNKSMEIFVAASQTVWGKNIHPLRGLSVGLNTHFHAY